MNIEKILIVDFGSQYTQLIARRVRELGVYSEIAVPSRHLVIDDENVKGIILSGGPNSVYDKGAPTLNSCFFEKDLPILGVCYGMQLISYMMGGKVQKSDRREFGRAVLEVTHKANPLFSDVPAKSDVWMSHSDKVVKIPENFVPIAKSGNTENAAIYSKKLNMFALQFHPEVMHTQFGRQMLSNFLDVCRVKRTWTPENYVDMVIKQIKEQAGTDTVISGISGGVDSAVASELVHRAIGPKLKCFMIDTGLLRMNEGRDTVKMLKEKMNLNVKYVDRSSLFLTRLKGVADPEKKRKIIGRAFIKVFEEQANQHKSARHLVQGTIYPDRIESMSTKGPSSTIKSHHNVGGLPKRMKLSLIEPLKDLFKDEVRKVGRVLEIPSDILDRHPFPGPGLGVRILGSVNKENIRMLKETDAIFIDTIRKYGLYSDIWQAFTVYLPVKSVGVMGDNRTYENVVVLRAVTSTDGMTADWFDFPKEVLHEASTRIINEVKGINRVVYDVSTKPPATIEWE